MEKENSKGILFGVLGILTLIIAIMGASLAYFTATTSSEGKEDITVQAATVAISYTQGQILAADSLIPVAWDVVEWAYEKETEQCVDKNGYQVCSVFPFSVTNGGASAQEITGTILTTTDLTGDQTTEFQNLMYTVYEVDANGNRTKVNTNNTTFGAHGVTTQVFNTTAGSTITLDSTTTKNYEIVIWLNELSEDVENDDGSGNQDFEQGLNYSGVINISVVGASDKITGISE